MRRHTFAQVMTLHTCSSSTCVLEAVVYRCTYFTCLIKNKHAGIIHPTPLFIKVNKTNTYSFITIINSKWIKKVDLLPPVYMRIIFFTSKFYLLYSKRSLLYIRFPLMFIMVLRKSISIIIYWQCFLYFFNTVMYLSNVIVLFISVFVSYSSSYDFLTL